MTTTQMAPGGFLAEARGLLTADMLAYGLPNEQFDALLRYLIDPDMHDFRLDELPSLTGDKDILSRSRRVLDLGCGPGTLVFKALQRGHEAEGIDLSEEKVRLGRAWVDAAGYPQEWKSRLNVVDAGVMPHADETFDLVSSYHVLEHVADLRSVLYEAVRVTKRGGWLNLCAPDYRMSYDTHYCMPWPRFMPPKQAEQWTKAMSRPATGIGTFFYITAPEVAALLQALGCRVHALVMRAHYRGQVRPWDGNLTVEPIVFRSDRDVADYAAEIKRLQQQNTLPPMYETCLEFTIAAQRL